MKTFLLTAGVAALLAIVSTVGASAESRFEEWRTAIAAGDTAQAATIVDELRAHGPEALNDLLALRQRLVVRRDGAAFDPEFATLPDEIAELDRYIDAVGGQRYCSTSHLFWYTDREQAQRAAAESGKPILSLRLLGHLTDELSCANSRFFRTMLYANAGISDYLREHFVLHWESVRPAPVMTIDFGDGRRMIRTVTGNSIHYVLDADGHPLDALPGLYGPQPFLEWLQRVNALAVAVNGAKSPDERSLILNSYHESRVGEIADQWRHDLEMLGLVPESPPDRAASAGRAEREAVPAEEAVVRAMTKMIVEVQPIAMITMTRADMTNLTTDAVWRDIALLHAEESELDQASRRLIFSEVPAALPADLVAVTKSGVERRSLAELFSSLRMSAALDSVRNEYQLHTQIHEWFIGGETRDVDVLNRRVYSELFLTPDTDPWLGLFDPTTYTGLTNAGIATVTE